MRATAEHVRAALLNRYSAENRYGIAFEVGNDTGYNGLRRCDAMVLSYWPSDLHATIGMEIKVSRSDWLTELKDVGKSLTFSRHCHTWDLVTAPNVVKAGELPPSWGLVVLNADGRLVRSAPSVFNQAPSPMPPGMLASFTRNAVKLWRDKVTIERNALKETLRTELIVEADQRVELANANEKRACERAQKAEQDLRDIRMRLTGKGAYYHNSHDVDAALEKVEAARLLDGNAFARALQEQATAMEHTIMRLRRSAEHLRLAPLLAEVS